MFHVIKICFKKVTLPVLDLPAAGRLDSENLASWERNQLKAIIFLKKAFYQIYQSTISKSTR
ncbi:hypothetical protein B0E43_17565 [Algoriphagus sp. A40]|nr:hypothetical protein B0E43_17565 [Algoriphagus sp. A40]